ncbi:hypothetical protein [Luteolibacter sp. AS25]|uniref:hypothetical protein n=1 Tax=Luteolibacter sp. AS25 TaxID=3135776 RepID=UPI00398A8592
MLQLQERQSASAPETTEDFTPEELAFLNAESGFLGYHLESLGESLGMGGMKFTVLRDSSILVGFREDKSAALLRGKHESLQGAINQLS